MKSWITAVAVLIGLSLVPTPALYAETPAELLEKGIYNEETVGDLSAAITLYRQVIETAAETRALAAKAQYRLGQCLLKQQKQQEAMKAFQTLVDDYPEQTEWVEKAKARLPDQVQLSGATWKDGQRETLLMRLAGGQLVGMIGLGADRVDLDGREVWKLSIRRLIGGGQNEGISRAYVDASTFRPIKTVWRHTVLGNADGQWTNGKLVIESASRGATPEKKTITLDDRVYCNDQWFFGFRQLPLAEGYTTTLPIRVAFTGGNAIDLKVEVVGRETVTTGLGELECWKLDTNIQQTFWISDTPERYLAKFVGGGVEATLQTVDQGDQPKNVVNDALGLSFNVPGGWFQMQPVDESDATAYVLAATGMASIELSVKEKSKLSDEDQSSLERWRDSKLKRGQGVYKEYQLREDSVQSTTVAGADAMTFLVDFSAGGSPKVSRVALALGDSKAVAAALVCDPDGLEQSSQAWNSLLQSIKIK